MMKYNVITKHTFLLYKNWYQKWLQKQYKKLLFK